MFAICKCLPWCALAHNMLCKSMVVSSSLLYFFYEIAKANLKSTVSGNDSS